MESFGLVLLGGLLVIDKFSKKEFRRWKLEVTFILIFDNGVLDVRCIIWKYISGSKVADKQKLRKITL